ncbi:hypothetical protein LTR73_009264, partial [Friedmanniomyces endolithicus]
MSKELNADMIIGCIDMPSGVPKRMPTFRTYLKDRPRSLNQRQLAKVNRHPEVVLARRVRDMRHLPSTWTDECGEGANAPLDENSDAID